MNSSEFPINEYVESLLTSKRLGNQVVYHTVLPSRPAVYTDAPPETLLGGMLQDMGINALYCHQQEAVAHIQAGHHVVVATPTASGKTLVYNLPVLERILTRPESRALYLFPLKALAQDQLRAFNELVDKCHGFAPTAAIYDGDTSAYRRKKIREIPPNVILTNPEMMHLAILPYHEKWAEFLSHLSFVVIDEVHTYRGILGSHMAQVLRRFRRICIEYGADPVFVFSSATIGNPEKLSAALTGLEVKPVLSAGAPEGGRHLIFMNPSDSPAHAAIMLLKASLHRGLRTIVYCQSRKMTELIALWAGSQKGAFAGKISAYRAGFLPEERRDIEQKLQSGELLAVISTSALELGIDIGDLDLCILVGYPGTVMATRQRGGRVGRSGRDSAVVMIAGEDALDQYIMRHAADFIAMPPESAMVNPENIDILEKHLVCAASEKPLLVDDPIFRGSAVRESINRLVMRGELLSSADGQVHYSARQRPHRHIDLRGSGTRYTIIDGRSNENRGEIDAFRAFKETHPGAVYLHLGETFRVDRLDIETKTVTVSRANPNYFTRVRGNKQTEILDIFDQRQVGGTQVGYGRLKVTDQVTGYEKLQIRDKRRINILPLDLPPQIFETEGLWIVIPDHVRVAVEAKQMHFMGGIHALEHSAIGICPLFILCDRNDLGGISIPYHPQVQNAAVFIYDAFPGGIGLCRSAFTMIEALLADTINVMADCACENGCPACVHSPKCGSGNRPLDKNAALYILRYLADPSHKQDDIAEIPKKAVLPQLTTAPKPGPKRYKDIEAYGVLDIETQRSAEEVGGWSMAHRMGVSCAVLFDAGINDYVVFHEHEIEKLIAHLNRLDLVVGFNIKRFDYRVLAGCVDFAYNRIPTLDILESIHHYLGYRLSLEHLARVSLGARKTGDGLKALEWWKQGRIDDIVAYCKKDVEITRNLFEFGRREGCLLFENKAGKRVRIPVDW